MKLMFTGDVNFRGLEALNFERSEKILAEVMPYIESVDFVIPNLECPLGDQNRYTPIKKAGPNLIGSENNICFLKAMKAYAVTLANNHIGDYGDEALRNTLKLLEENGIRYVGAGNNTEEAYRALKAEKDGVTVSVLSVCENEFGIAEENKAGSAGYAPRRLMNAIRAEKANGAFTVVVFHGGNEHNPLPSPDTVERYRMICDMGADAVIAGHTHCPQGFEIYDGKPIVYSMGNFLFGSSEKRDERDPWYYGYFSVLEVGKKGVFLETVPYKFNAACTEITVFDGKERDTMHKYIDTLSDIIQKPEALKAYFKGWAMNHLWVPLLPESLDDLSHYNASGNYDLLKCEAHLSQAKQIFEILFNDEADAVKPMQRKIEELRKMPV